MTQEITPAFKTALKYIAVCLRHLDPVSYGAYRLRRVRYNLLRNNGIKAHMTYPRMDKECVHGANGTFKHVSPVRIRYISRMASGGISTAESVLGMRYVRS
jgi:hypothetical protein